MSLEAVERKFYDYHHHDEDHVADVHHTEPYDEKKLKSKQKLVEYVRNSIIGEKTNFETPFGTRKLIYCDYTASGRSVEFIENYIRTEVLPFYGNTHTTTSITGRQSTFYRHESRDYIKRCMNGREDDVLLFCGSGSTTAINKLIDLLNLRIYDYQTLMKENKKVKYAEEDEEEEKEDEEEKKFLNKEIIVFVSEFEHHSNLLPWRELNAKVILIHENSMTGELNYLQLQNELQKYSSEKYLKFGSFTAASNITGIKNNQFLITFLLHYYNALSFWDFASAAPYVKIDMNPIVTDQQIDQLIKDLEFYEILNSFSRNINIQSKLNIQSHFKSSKNSQSDSSHADYDYDDDQQQQLLQKIRNEISNLLHQNKEMLFKDAIFLSPHKFLGGVETPGLLLMKRKQIHTKIPHYPGGGSIFYVTEKDHRYLRQIEEREEAGTPDIIGSIRVGLTFQLKEQISTQFILYRENQLINRAIEFLGETTQNLHILGSTILERIGIFSFMITDPNTKLYLHHNFVCSVLNDFFGIQVRGGCVCAGPYSQTLLGMPFDLAKKYEDLLIHSSFNDERLDSVLPRERDRRGKGLEVFRPGFIRLNFHFTLDDTTFEFILNALHLIATYGWMLLPLYKINIESGEFIHNRWSYIKDRKWINSIQYFGARSENNDTDDDEKVGFFYPIKANSTSLSNSHINDDNNETEKEYFEKTIREFHELIANDGAKIQQYFNLNSLESQPLLFSSIRSQNNEDLRWFLLPSEAADFLLHNPLRIPPPPPPFIVKHYISANDIKKMAHHDHDVVHLKNNNCEVMNDENGDDDDDDENINYRSADVKKKVLQKKEEEKKEEEENTFNELLLGDYSDDEILDECDRLKLQEKEKKRLENMKLKYKFHVPSQSILKGALEAIEKYNMIQDGDRVLVCISGGKDSLSMLHLLKHYQLLCEKKSIFFKLGAATVDPQTPETFDPSPLIGYMQSLGVPYFYESEPVMQRARDLENCTSICSYCSRMKRGMLYSCARREGYNVLSMGQHLDDLAESFMMSVLHNGLMRTMKVNYYVEQGDLRVIRPLCYIRERDLAKFAEKAKLPVIAENCPACFSEPKERHRIKQLLAAQENMFPGVFKSLRTSIEPLMAINKCGVEGTSDALSATAPNPNSKKQSKKVFIDFGARNNILQ